MSIIVRIPVLTVSESNSHEHWRHRQRRAKNQRMTTVLMLVGPFRALRPKLPCVVTLTRISPRALDDDNLRGALKHVRDGVADALGLKSDRDPRVRWEYGQAKEASDGMGEKAVEVRVERREAVS